MAVEEAQANSSTENRDAFADLNAVYLNCTLKHPVQESHTALLMEASAEIMRKNGVAVEIIRPTAYHTHSGHC